MSAIYSYYYQDFSNDDSLPRVPYNLFCVKLRFKHFYQFSHPESITTPCCEINQTYTFPREQLLSDQEGPRIIASILSLTGSSPEIIESMVSDILNFASDMQRFHNDGTDRRGLLMVINMLVKTPCDDEEIIDSLMESNADLTQSRPADKDAVRKLEKVKVHDLDSITQCAICLEKFHDVDVGITLMACGHFYHEECIVKWLETSNTCPLCRYEMPCSDD